MDDLNATGICPEWQKFRIFRDKNRPVVTPKNLELDVL
jgi:hypothetical protein